VVPKPYGRDRLALGLQLPELEMPLHSRTLLPSLLSMSLAAFAGCAADDTNYRPRPTDPNQPGETVAARATYVSELRIPGMQGDVPGCCIDFGKRSRDFIEDGTENPDNAFARLAGLVGAFVDFQAVLDGGIEDGKQVVLLNHVGLADSGGAFRLEALLGEFDGATDFDIASGGDGTFKVKAESYKSGKAVISMPGKMEDLEMTAGPSDFSLRMPIGDALVAVNLKETKLTGAAAFDADGISYVDGTIGGYALVDDFFTGLNAYVAENCSCLGTSNLFTKSGNKWAGNCVADAATKCADEDSCAAIGGDALFDGQACPLLADMLQNTADVDTNNDPSVYEGISVGLEWVGVPATIAK